MTIIIGKSELLTGWMPLPLMNPHMGDILEKMKQDLGIGWNLVQSGIKRGTRLLIFHNQGISHRECLYLDNFGKVP